MRTQHVIVLLFAAVLAGCNPQTPDPADVADRGAALLAPFKADLKAALIDGMQEGPAAAIAVCSEQAPAIAERLSVHGVRMGRSSHRLRNPDNAPPDWLRSTIDGYATQAVELAPRVIDLGGGRSGYVEPIVMQPLCLTCHGETLSPEIAASLLAKYPDDQATGFAEADFRGVFWVEF